MSFPKCTFLIDLFWVCFVVGLLINCTLLREYILRCLIQVSFYSVLSKMVSFWSVHSSNIYCKCFFKEAFLKWFFKKKCFQVYFCYKQILRIVVLKRPFQKCTNTFKLLHRNEQNTSKTWKENFSMNNLYKSFISAQKPKYKIGWITIYSFVIQIKYLLINQF